MSLNHFHAHAHAHFHDHFPTVGLRSARAHSHTTGHGHAQASPPSSPYPHDDDEYEPSAVSPGSQHKMRSKRDSAKYMREKDYVHDRSLLEVVDKQRCDRCDRNGWRCFIEANPDSPRRVCRPCGKNKCSFGNTIGARPATKVPSWADDKHKKARRYEPYAPRERERECRELTPLPGISALTAWARPLTPPQDAPSREGSLELLAEASAQHASRREHERERTPLPDQFSTHSYAPYDALPFTPWELHNDHRFYTLAMDYARQIPTPNRYSALAGLFHDVPLRWHQ
ncbi:hypothetical protein CspeluHIS016_0302460 [Cutaneotrichosporon spelunceum]|uniref:Uncharacterized protein n=1 Tax=Cutaneotrichosporon spelunceum TaxID=1672016 RepID=A0AAD3YAW4_9TREE|nr:hypothetical protein CspeluHIS016_0302460 [Cutaneotrichosporon spelunceum]